MTHHSILLKLVERKEESDIGIAMELQEVMGMYLENIKVRTREFYSVGYCPDLDKYLLAITVPYVSYYNQYYIISQEEYILWQSDVEKLDVIARECREENIHSKRFLYSELDDENTKEQLEILYGKIARRKYNPAFERI